MVAYLLALKLFRLSVLMWATPDHGMYVGWSKGWIGSSHIFWLHTFGEVQ